MNGNVFIFHFTFLFFFLCIAGTNVCWKRLKRGKGVFQMLIVGNKNVNLMHMKEVTDYAYLMWGRVYL